MRSALKSDIKPHPAANWCLLCKKWGYKDHSQTQTQRKTLEAKEPELVIVYRGDCGKWHLGHPYRR